MGTPCGRDVVVRSLVLMQRLTLDLERDAEVALGPSLTASLDVRLLRLVHRDGGASSSSLVDQLALPRSTVARSLARVRDVGFVRRDGDPQDARRARWRLTPLGRRRVEQYVAATADTFRLHRTHVEQLLLAHVGELGPADDGPVGGSPAAAVLDAVEAQRRAEAAMDREAARSSATVGLSGAVDRTALLAVAERCSARPGELAEVTGLSPAGVTSLVDRLEGHRLVVRKRGTQGDGRAVVVSLTPSGRRAVDTLVEVFHQNREALLGALEMTLTIGTATADHSPGSHLRHEQLLR